MRTLTYWTSLEPRDTSADDELVLDCLTDAGLPRDWQLVRGVEYTGHVDEDSSGVVFEVEVYI